MSWGAASDGAGGRRDQPVGEDARRREKRGTVAIPIPGTAVHTHMEVGDPQCQQRRMVACGEWGLCVLGSVGIPHAGKKAEIFFFCQRY